MTNKKLDPATVEACAKVAETEKVAASDAIKMGAGGDYARGAYATAMIIRGNILALPTSDGWLPIEGWLGFGDELLLWEPIEDVPEGMVYVGSFTTGKDGLGEWVTEKGEAMNPVLYQRINYPLQNESSSHE